MNKFKIENLPNDDLKLLSAEIGLENVKVLCEMLGGSTLYIPKLDIFDRHKRNLSILSDYKKGLSYNKLARKYNLSTVTIRKITSSF